LKDKYVVSPDNPCSLSDLPTQWIVSTGWPMSTQ